MAAKISIIVRTSFVAVHQWKDAPMEVEYLKAIHRHVFHVEAKIPVTHNDRQLEFFMVKKFLNKAIASLYPDERIGQVSCEMIAESLLKELSKNYGIKKDLSVYVSEDNENGAIVEI